MNRLTDPLSVSRYPRCTAFLDELQALCRKHKLLMVHKSESIELIGEDEVLIGKLMAIHAGRMIYQPNE